MRIRRCPNCRGLPGSYTERWREHGIRFDALENGAITDGPGDKFDGEPYAVDATCRECGFQWRLRGIQQITELQDPPATTKREG